MLGRSILASGMIADDRVFVYEVAGLRQTDQTDGSNHEIRHSSNVLMQIPFGRMNEFMQQMNRLGAHIVNIRSSDGVAVMPHQEHAADDGGSSKGKEKKH
jgi:phycocyanin-associated, rod